MMPSPIQLLQLTFKRIFVEIDAQHAPDEAPNSLSTVFDFDGVSITTEVGSREIDADHERGVVYMVSLRVLVNNQPPPEDLSPKYSPYLIDVEAVGIVLLQHGAERLGTPADLVSVNGVSLLWSAIREQLLTLTSRMPIGPVMLPTVHFHDLKQKDAGASLRVKKTAASAAGKSARPSAQRKAGI